MTPQARSALLLPARGARCKSKSFPRRVCARALRSTTLILSQQRGRPSAERRMPTIVRALSAATHPSGMRPPSGASPRLCHQRDCRRPASTPGRASWDGELTQSDLRSPSSSAASSSRAGLYAGRAVSGSPESGLQIRAREPHSLRFQECPREGMARERLTLRVI